MTESKRTTAPFDAEVLAAQVMHFCRFRDVDAQTRVRLVRNLAEAFDIVRYKGPDLRWKSLAARHCGSDLPAARTISPAAAERRAYDHSPRVYDHSPRVYGHPEVDRPWWLRHVVVSGAHWERFSLAIGVARAHGLGWMIPANKDILIVPRPALRHLEDQPDVLHDDSGQMAVEWPDGSGFHFLRGTAIESSLYQQIISGELPLHAVTEIDDADVRSIALSYRVLSS